MREVTNKELSSFKILPFDLYSDTNSKILDAGEVLTPGKLIMLKNYPKIYTEEFENEIMNSQKPDISNKKLKELTQFSYDTLDAIDFDTVINRDFVLEVDEQVKVKYFYRKTLDLLLQGYYKEGLEKLVALSHIIASDVYNQFRKTQKGSQIRFLGEYEICHPLNVAVVSGLIAKRLEITNPELEQVILAALLHDIGKFKIKLRDKSSLLTPLEEEVMAHTRLGYDLIKNELNLSEDIAKVALEHHENNDGSGYPQGLSSDYISLWAQIVNVANYYDNLACNRFPVHVACNRDALRNLLEVGTKRFSAQVLYTFIHMFNYDDPKDFDEMTF